MAVSTERITRQSIGAMWLTVTDVTPDASFAAGGEALAMEDIGCDFVVYGTIVDVPGGYQGNYDRTTEELFVYQQTDPADAGGADVPLVEAATVDLSATTIRITALGR